MSFNSSEWVNSWSWHFNLTNQLTSRSTQTVLSFSSWRNSLSHSLILFFFFPPKRAHFSFCFSIYFTRLQTSSLTTDCCFSSCSCFNLPSPRMQSLISLPAGQRKERKRGERERGREAEGEMTTCWQNDIRRGQRERAIEGDWDE